MNKKTFTLLICLLTLNVYSQQTIMFLDSASNTPIEFFSVFNTNKEYLLMGDIDGKITLSKEFLKKNDTIIFYHISYPQISFATKELKNKIVISTKRYNIDCVTITEKKLRYKNIKIGCLGKNCGWIIMSPTAHVGIYIPNNYKDKDIKIKEMNVYIEDAFFDPTQIFRINLFNGNYNKQVGNDILLGRNVYANAKKGGSWVKIDLDSLNIYLPQDGIIAAVECLGSKKSDKEYKEYCDKNKINNDNIFKYICKEHYLAKVRYGFKISYGKRGENCNNKNVAWERDGLGQWSKSKSELMPSIYLKLKIKTN